MATYKVELHLGEGPDFEVEADHMLNAGGFLSFNKKHETSNIAFGPIVKMIEAHRVREVTQVSK